MQQTFEFEPPRIVNVPAQPPPQTVCMTLEHSGVPVDEQEMITDIPPDFGWMTLLQRYQTSFTVDKNDLPQKELLSLNVLNVEDVSGGDPGYIKNMTWAMVPFLGSRWWNGVVSFKLVAIKAPRITGKILVRYSFDPYDDFKQDSRRRSIAKEWDLGQSSTCEFDIVGANTIRARPTWVPHVKNGKYHPGTVYGASWLEQATPIQTYHFGSLCIELAQKLQVGSIFPDKIRILVFKSFKNAEFYMPTDFRGEMPHSLAMGSRIAPNKS